MSTSKGHRFERPAAMAYVEPCRQRVVTLRVVGRGDTVELHLEDEGPGFPDGFLAVAFERFSRADGARTREGAGLGRAIVRSIAHAHGGEVRVANRPGGGADVWLAFPARHPSFSEQTSEKLVLAPR